MNILKTYNACRALKQINALNNAKLIGSNNWRTRQTLIGISDQEQKLAIALSDTGYRTLHNAVKFKDEFGRSNSFGEFFAMVQTQISRNEADPLSEAMAILNK